MRVRFYNPTDPSGVHPRYLWFERDDVAEWIALDGSATTTAPAGRLVNLTFVDGRFDYVVEGVRAGTYFVEARLVDSYAAPVTETVSAVAMEDFLPSIKGRIAAARLTASGATGDLDLTTSRRQTLYLHHSNGSGAVTTAALISVQVRASGGSYVESQAITASRVDGATNTTLVELPDDCDAAKVVYTAPVGPTGAALDLQIGTLTTS